MTGSGTLTDPYIIYDVNDLQNIQNDLAAYYELANDIDASATVGWNGGEGFVPIANFSGHLDGKGYEVDALFMNRAGSPGVAFIDYTYGPGQGEIINLGLTNVDITATSGWCAGFIRLNYGTVRHCSVTGSATGNSWTGGFVQSNVGTIEDCSSGCTVVTSVGYAGGFVESNGGIIRRCSETGDATAASDVGGFVRTNAFAGALIQDCYCRGNVISSGNANAGGFIDHNFVDAVVDNCFSTGTVTTTGSKGGFCRLNQGAIITNSFWDTESSGEATSDGGTGRTTAQMKTESTFTDAGWNFASVWDISPPINNGYPILVPRPSVTTNPATGVGMILAGFNGLLNDDVGEPCECGFEWGPDDTYGLTTPTETKTTGQTFSQTIYGLFPGTEYHYRAFATNSYGTAYGADMSFGSQPSFSRGYALAREEL